MLKRYANVQVLLTPPTHAHTYSTYCLSLQAKRRERVCRWEFGSLSFRRLDYLALNSYYSDIMSYRNCERCPRCTSLWRDRSKWNSWYHQIVNLKGRNICWPCVRILPCPERTGVRTCLYGMRGTGRHHQGDGHEEELEEEEKAVFYTNC